MSRNLQSSASRQLNPMSPLDKTKSAIWKIIAPIFPHLRDFLLKVKLIRHQSGRQKYPLGWLGQGLNRRHLEGFLAKHNFKKHAIAWVDEGEVLGLRRLETFRYQYHLRVFADGEVRGHFEVAPEYKPIHHLKEKGMEHRREVFLTFLQGLINQAPAESTLSHKSPAASREGPENG